jgi:membrane-anchored protein YejM (alkaline phosphatase superfamily)
MTKAQRLTELNRLQDRACNIDYLKRPLTYEAIARNINILEQKILYKEY